MNTTPAAPSVIADTIEAVLDRFSHLTPDERRAQIDAALAYTARHKDAVRKACASTFRAGPRVIMFAALLATLTLTACGPAPVSVPTMGLDLYDCPTSWDPLDVADSIDAMIDAAPIEGIEDRRLATDAVNRTDIMCEDRALSKLSDCGRTDVHGGCVLFAPSPFDRHEARLFVRDLDTDEVEPLCSSYLTVEVAKIVAVSQGLPVQVVAGPLYDGDPLTSDPAWTDAAWACVDSSTDGAP